MACSTTTRVFVMTVFCTIVKESVRLFFAQNKRLRAMLWMLVSRTLVTRVEEKVVTVFMIVTLVTITSLLCLHLPVEFELVELVMFVGAAFKIFRADFAFIAPSRAL